MDKASNYRGISLLDLGYKLLNKIIWQRVAKWVEFNRHLGESQQHPAQDVAPGHAIFYTEHTHRQASVDTESEIGCSLRRLLCGLYLVDRWLLLLEKWRHKELRGRLDNMIE